MRAYTEMTDEEKDEVFDQYCAAKDRGDYEEAYKIATQIPIHPSLAKWAREVFTPEQIKEYGFIMPDEE